MNVLEPELTVAEHKIATLVDHQRDGRYVVAFCPICDHAEEAEDDGTGRGRTESVSVAKIKVHISNRHRPKPVKVKLSAIGRSHPQT